ncbi:MAG: response regulator [Candidatus Limiplasma sp.]|nr:response regulator [Candidatus Limiplasma sp.]
MYSVVVMDDNRATADMLAFAIDWNAVGCEVAGVAYDGIHGRLLIAQKKPDIIITDIRMPGMNGLEMIETARDLSPHSKVIYISSYDEFAYAKKALDLRAFDYLLKPFENDKLVRIVQRIIEEKETPTKPEPDTAAGYSLIVSRILRYIQENPSRQLSLQALSRHFDLTPSYISTLIKKETGRNYLDWVTQARMKLAKRLLLDPTYRIEEIASVVGYKNYVSFYNVFVRYMGLSPSDYRNGGGGQV